MFVNIKKISIFAVTSFAGRSTFRKFFLPEKIPIRMQIVEVKSREERKEFLDFPRRLYKDDPYWVCPLDDDTESLFDPAINHLLKEGEAARWILRNGDGTTIGRIAAFIDPVRAKVYNQKTGGMGFFEVIDDREAAFALFDTAIKWNIEKGMEAVDGPINFGENDTNWGLLVDGFMQQAYGMPYNMKYYRDFFEDYGFRNYFEQYSYHRMVRNGKNEIIEFPPRIMKIAEWLSRRPGYSFRHFSFAQKEKFAADFVDIYNSTWSAFKEDFTPAVPGMIEGFFKKASQILDEELVWFAYFNDKPIAFFVLIPDVNQIIKYFNGHLTLWNKLRFVYYKANHRMTRARAIVGGVNPLYHNSGVESAIFLHIYQAFRKKPWFNELELSWVGDFNPKMMAIYEAIGANKAKTHITFRYLVDRDAPFMRYKDEMFEKSKLAERIEGRK